LLDPATGKTIRQLHLPQRNNIWSRAIAFAPDGKTLAAGLSLTNPVVLWDVATGQQLPETAPRGVKGVAVSSNGNLGPSAGGDGVIRLWDAATGKALRKLLTKGNPWNASVQFSPDGTALVAAGADGLLRLWDVDSGNERLVLHGHKGAAYAATFSPDG